MGLSRECSWVEKGGGALLFRGGNRSCTGCSLDGTCLWTVFFVFVECASSKEYGFFPLAILEGFALFEGFPATFCMISVTRFAKPLLGLFLGRFDDVQVLCLFGVKRPESHACFGLAKDTGSSKQLLHLLRKESGILEIPFVRVVPVFFVIPNASLFASPGFESEVGSL